MAHSISGQIREKFTQVYFWCDRQIVLYWIANDKHNYKEYIGKRIQLIRRPLDYPSSWKFCPGNLNPSDLLTRGITSQELFDSELWKEGPSFIREPVEHFSKKNEFCEVPPEAMSEIKKKTVVAAITINKSTPLFDYTKYSDSPR
jgi:hypothetical protein